MRTRNPNSEHQLAMSILFDKDTAAKLPSKWSEWPEPQRSIYGRALSKKVSFVKTSFKRAAIKARTSIMNIANDFESLEIV